MLPAAGGEKGPEDREVKEPQVEVEKVLHHAVAGAVAVAAGRRQAEMQLAQVLAGRQKQASGEGQQPEAAVKEGETEQIDAAVEEKKELLKDVELELESL